MKLAFLLDTSSFIHRAYHVSKERQTYTKDGVPNAAVRVFSTMLNKLKKQYHPDYMIAACDVHKPTFRTKLYPLYKATRPAPPDELIQQIPGCMAVLAQEFVPTFELPGYEADDIIGTLAQKIVIGSATDVVIVSGDKDVAQLITLDGRIKVLNTGKNRMLDAAAVFELYGVRPHQLMDYLALVGDTSDNVPGARGIGPAGAVTLLRSFGTLEAILERSSEILLSSYRHAIQQQADIIRLSKRLVTIDCDVPLEGLCRVSSFVSG